MVIYAQFVLVRFLSQNMVHVGPLTVLSWEKRFSAKHLGQDTAHGPHINGLGVFLEGQHDLWGSVPSRGNVFGHESRIVLLGSGGSRQTKVTHLQVTVRVEKEIGGLEISVENVGRVHSLQCAQGLVDEVLAMVIRQVLSADDSVHIRLH